MKRQGWRSLAPANSTKRTDENSRLRSAVSSQRTVSFCASDLARFDHAKLGTAPSHWRNRFWAENRERVVLYKVVARSNERTDHRLQAVSFAFARARRCAIDARRYGTGLCVPISDRHAGYNRARGSYTSGYPPRAWQFCRASGFRVRSTAVHSHVGIPRRRIHGNAGVIRHSVPDRLRSIAKSKSGYDRLGEDGCDRRNSRANGEGASAHREYVRFN